MARDKKKALHERRRRRLRGNLARARARRVRLSVFRSHKHIYAQVIDDLTGETRASASTVEKSVRSTIGNGANIAAAEAIGRLVAERALKAKVDSVVFDRGGYIYHGRVKALAEAAREAGLRF